jgi:hypothetical protein
MLNLGLMACAARLLPPAAALLGKQMLQVVSGDLPGRDDAGDSGIVELVRASPQEKLEMLASQPHTLGHPRRHHRQRADRLRVRFLVPHRANSRAAFLPRRVEPSRLTRNRWCVSLEDPQLT